MASSSNEKAVEVAISLQNVLSPSSKVLTDPTSALFKASMSRWSSSDALNPSAILLPATENDVLKIVQKALAHQIPIVPKSGGSTPFSTLPRPSWIIDLSLLTTITIHSSPSPTATIGAGVLTKALNTTLSAHSPPYITPAPASALVAYIPFLLGGGSSLLSGQYGMASDSLLSARIITASGKLILCSKDVNKDLFWALKGAGWFFGIVVSVEVKIYRAKEEEGRVVAWTCLFPVEKVAEVGGVVEEFVRGAEREVSGMCAVGAAPGTGKPVLIVSITHFNHSTVNLTMAPLFALNPFANIKKIVPWANITDATDAQSSHGGSKSLLSCGLQAFDGKQFVKTLETWQKMVDEALETKGTTLMFTWSGMDVVRSFADEESAWSHRDCAVWFLAFIMTEDSETNNVGRKHVSELIASFQATQKDEEVAMFPNHSRGSHLGYLYRGEERLEKLKGLKQIWDPQGVFTRELL